MFRTKLITATAIASALIASPFASLPASAGPEEYLGELMLVGFSFCPKGTVDAAGQLMSIAQNTALFSLLGTTYGGDGITTFGIPDLRGRIPLNVGTGPGLPNYQQGQVGGSPSTSLTSSNLPPHTHTAVTTSTLKATSTVADLSVPTGHILGDDQNDRIYSAAAPNVDMNAASIVSTTTVGVTGNGAPVATQSPYLTLRWCVVTQGIYPARPN